MDPMSVAAGTNTIEPRDRGTLSPGLAKDVNHGGHMQTMKSMALLHELQVSEGHRSRRRDRASTLGVSPATTLGPAPWGGSGPPDSRACPTHASGRMHLPEGSRGTCPDGITAYTRDLCHILTLIVT